MVWRERQESLPDVQALHVKLQDGDVRAPNVFVEMMPTNSSESCCIDVIIASVEVLSCISSCPSESPPFLHFCDAIVLQTQTRCQTGLNFCEMKLSQRCLLIHKTAKV